ncbi:MAG: hypothetical protein GYB55_08115 [Cytophagales bacterium]|nr:hypothetical protein [Cytophagales bacterium]|tara:strand:+ start:99167 stop:99973 length:807 start_codon:yes stop_codon:yes gene_type:complete
MKFAGKRLILGLFGRMISMSSNPIKKEWYLLFLIVIVTACKAPNEAETIINQSIKAHGGDLYQSAEISFTFRERQYKIFKSPNSYSYSRSFNDEGKKTVDVLNKEGFSREVNGQKVALPEEEKIAYTNSVNSVAYFAFLPYGLNDAAVIKKSMGAETIEGKEYNVIKVTFEKEGGGEDFEDEFLYWINKETHLVDYLAYSYHTDGGGLRFRKAINTHEISGLILQDYENYKPEDESLSVEDLSELFKNGELKLLSEILLEDIQVKFVN